MPDDLSSPQPSNPEASTPESFLKPKIFHSGTPKTKVVQEEETEKLPKFIKTTETNTYKKEDPPLIDLKITNPVTYLKLYLKRLLRNEGIDFRVRVRPLTAIAMFLAFSTFFAGTGFSIGQLFFPNSSPILKRSVTFQGIVKKTDTGAYYINLSDNTLYRLQPKTSADYRQYINKEVMVKGNLTKEPNVINVSQINVFDTTTSP